MARAVVRGAGDVGSAVAHRLFSAGHAVVVHDEPATATTRRWMAFADALFDGTAELAGVRAVLVADPAELAAVVEQRALVPVTTARLDAVLAEVAPDVLVDARMRKRSVPENQRSLAPLTVGLGPSFLAGGNVDVAVETSWDDLGRIITRGPTLPLAGEPRPIAGHARDRYVYAPVGGTFETRLRVGDPGRAGDPVARIGQTVLSAPLDGVPRGLTRDGVPVASGTKVIEVDPRRDGALVAGIGERPARIADAVAEVVRRWRAGQL